MALNDATSAQPKLCTTLIDTLNAQARLVASFNRLDAVAQRLGATPPPPTPGNSSSGETSKPAVPNLSFLLNTSNAAAADAVNRLEDIVQRLEAQA